MPSNGWSRAAGLDEDPPRRVPEDGSGPVAAIDCGTNSTRLLVVDPAGEVLERLMRITRLGQGVDSSGRLAPDAVARTLAVLREYGERMRSLGVRRGRLVATSAVRDATNAGELLAAAEDATGLLPEVLDGVEEGRLSFAGATAHLPALTPRGNAGAAAPGQGAGQGTGHAASQGAGYGAGYGAGRADGPTVELVVDIGGGSTELVAGVPAGSTKPGGVDGWEEPRVVSMDVGCVRLTERCFHHDPPLAGELDDAVRVVGAALAPAVEKICSPASCAPGAGLPVSGTHGGLSRLIGLAGTVSTLACLARGIERYDRAKVHHAVLSIDEVREWLSRLSSESSARRLRHPGMVPGREDVIVGGLVVLVSVMEAFGRGECLVSEDDILDGLVASVLAS
ncbi:MAG: exopolyphosphatase [Actinomycetota bacterium]|nr:exopolyphosphatase [Actinomycetota bacterium]